MEAAESTHNPLAAQREPEHRRQLEPEPEPQPEREPQPEPDLGQGQLVSVLAAVARAQQAVAAGGGAGPEPEPEPEPLANGGRTMSFRSAAKAVAAGTRMRQSGAEHSAMATFEAEVVEQETEEQEKENRRDRRRRLAAKSLEKSSMIDPNGVFRRKWDIVQMLLLLYVAFGVPYRLGFTHPVILWSGWFWFDAFTDAYFVADIFVSFRTAFYNVHGELVVDSALVKRNYVQTWFPVDIAACLPFHYINFAFESEGDSSTRIIKLLRMLRLLKLLRLARVNRLLQRYEEEFASLMTTFKLGKLVAVILVIGHWLSCLFFGLGSVEEFLVGEGWDAGTDSSGEQMQGWVARQFDLEGQCGHDQCRWQKYLTSFYWATMTMTTVGYGDIAPHTTFETYAVIAGMITGGFVFGLIVGELGELSQRANAGELMRQEAVSKTQAFLGCGVTKGQVTAETGKRIKAYYANFYDQRTAMDLLDFILCLPPKLRDEMASQMHWIDGVCEGDEVWGLLHKVPFLSGLSTTATITICARMKAIHITLSDPVPGADPNDRVKEGLITEEGDDAEEMYIVVEGSKAVVLTRESSHEQRVLSAGDYFGELAALLPPTMAEQRKRTHTAYAITEVQLGMLDYDDVMWLREQSFEVSEKVVAYTNQRMGTAQPTLSLLEPYPELEFVQKGLEEKTQRLEEKLDLVLELLQGNIPASEAADAGAQGGGVAQTLHRRRVLRWLEARQLGQFSSHVLKAFGDAEFPPADWEKTLDEMEAEGALAEFIDAVGRVALESETPSHEQLPGALTQQPDQQPYQPQVAHVAQQQEAFAAQEEDDDDDEDGYQEDGYQEDV